MSKFDDYTYKADGCSLTVYGVLFVADRPEQAILRYRAGETVFWNSWRGSFCGILHDETNDTTLLFNDHIGSKILFYAQTKNGFFYARNIKELSKKTGFQQPNEAFIKAIIDKGYTTDNSTICQGIYRLLAGQYLIVQGNEFQLKTYHRFDNTPWPYK